MVVFVLTFLFVVRVFADASADSTAKAGSKFNFDSGKDPVWQKEVGDGFRKHANETGLMAGGGFGLRIFGGRKDHDVALGTVHYGTMLSGPLGGGHFWRGNFELLGDLFGGEQYNHHTAYVVGIAPLIRYDFATGTPLVPYFGGGAGPSLTDIRHPDLSTDFEFNVQVDAGVHWFIKPRWAATIEGRWLHLSNGGIDHPNQGVNSSLILIGVNWFF